YSEDCQRMTWKEPTACQGAPSAASSGRFETAGKDAKSPPNGGATAANSTGETHGSDRGCIPKNDKRRARQRGLAMHRLRTPFRGRSLAVLGFAALVLCGFQVQAAAPVDRAANASA